MHIIYDIVQYLRDPVLYRKIRLYPPVIKERLRVFVYLHHVLDDPVRLAEKLERIQQLCPRTGLLLHDAIIPVRMV